MTQRLARAMAGLKPYEQPFQGLHNEPYTLPPFQQPGMSLPPEAYISSPTPAIPRPGAMAPPAQPQVAVAPPTPHPAPMPQAMPGSDFPQAMPPGSMPPVTIGQQAMQVGRNELERDYYRQLAENPNGFGTGWLGRQFG